jgi:hypothetical protein
LNASPGLDEWYETPEPPRLAVDFNSGSAAMPSAHFDPNLPGVPKVTSVGRAIFYA